MFEKNGLPFAPITQARRTCSTTRTCKATGGLAPMTLARRAAQTQVPLLPLTLGGERLGVRLQPPLLGEHGAELLAELGYDQAQIEALRIAKVTVTS